MAPDPKEESRLRPYMCKHFKWASWTHYGMKMPEFSCEFQNYELGSCQGICEKFEKRKGQT